MAAPLFDGTRYLLVGTLADSFDMNSSSVYGALVLRRTATPWDGAIDVSGWKYLGWFGYFLDGGGLWGGWIYHAEHGWLFSADTTSSNIWIWTRLGWLWTSDGVYPFMWRAGTGAWLFYFRGTGNGSGGWFYNYSAGSTQWL